MKFKTFSKLLLEHNLDYRKAVSDYFRKNSVFNYCKVHGVPAFTKRMYISRICAWEEFCEMFFINYETIYIDDICVELVVYLDDWEKSDGKQMAL